MKHMVATIALAVFIILLYALVSPTDDSGDGDTEFCETCGDAHHMGDTSPPVPMPPPPPPPSELQDGMGSPGEDAIAVLLPEAHTTLYWPTPGFYRITSPFGYRSDPFTGFRDFHNGVDIGAPRGAYIMAAWYGTVTQSVYCPFHCGNLISVYHGNGLFTLYAHALERFVVIGQQVQRGEVIAIVGMTGRSTGYHLHFGMMLGGRHIDPMLYF